MPELVDVIPDEVKEQVVNRCTTPEEGGLRCNSCSMRWSSAPHSREIINLIFLHQRENHPPEFLRIVERVRQTVETGARDQIEAAGTNTGPNVPRKCGALSTPVPGTPVMGQCRHMCSGDEGHEGKHHCPTCNQDWT